MTVVQAVAAATFVALAIGCNTASPAPANGPSRERLRPLSTALLAQLQHDAPARIESARTVSETARQLADRGQFAEALAQCEGAQRSLVPFDRLTPVPEGLVETRAALTGTLEYLNGFKSAYDTIQAANARVAQREAMDYADYDQGLTRFAEALGQISPPSRERFARDIEQSLRAIERRRRSIRRNVQRALRTRAEQEALAVLCGSEPVLGPWDGELVGAERYVKQSAHDPGSIDVEHCTPPVLTRNLCWVSVCDVVGNNAFGARVRNRMRFSVGAGGAILGAAHVR